MFKFLDMICDNGTVKTWFSWLEWLTITAAFVVAALKTDAIVLYAIAIFSAVLVTWFAVRKSLHWFIENLFANKSYLTLKKIIGFPLAFFMPLFAIYLVAQAIWSFVE